MRILFFIYFTFIPSVLFSQIKLGNNNNKSLRKQEVGGTEKKATIDMYRFITLTRDTIYQDTSLTIKKEYAFNYLRKDIFGLLPFSNEGQTYNRLQYSLTKISPYPEIGFKAKHFNFMEADEIMYNSVATPLTELYFRSVFKKGQSVDSFFTLNITPSLNFSIAYKGLRSVGAYINQLTSTGNFRFTTSYNTSKKRYILNAHFTSQDILNEENGGITTPVDFESEDPKFNTRQSLEVYLTDAKSFLKGKRYFADQIFRINPTKGANNLYITHQFNYENKFFEYNQATVKSTIITNTFNRFGDSFLLSNINDQTHYNKMYNRVGAIYENTTLGKFQFFIDDFRSNYYYTKILIFDTKQIPASLSRNINNVGGQYEYKKKKWEGHFLLSRSITNQSLSNIEAKLNYKMSKDIQFLFGYQNLNKLPNDNYNLYQSSYVIYNWSNDFKNEKINSLTAKATTPWLAVDLQLTTLNDHLYFQDIATVPLQQIVAPKQYENTINYISIKGSKEFKFGNFALDNTILYQKVDQKNTVLNVPELVSRNTIYYSNYAFKKALYFQTGFTLNYFSSYFSDDYNPVIGEFFVQNKKRIGSYPNLDFFVNAKIQRTRVYLKAEHFNSAYTGNNYYSSPNNPYRDFTIRFGLVWNFFN